MKHIWKILKSRFCFLDRCKLHKTTVNFGVHDFTFSFDAKSLNLGIKTSRKIRNLEYHFKYIIRFDVNRVVFSGDIACFG